MKKNNSVRTILSAIAVLIFVTTASAQDSTRLPTLKAAAETAYTEAWAKLAQNLGLTADQVTQWKALNQADLKQAQAILSNPSLTNAEKKGQLETLHAQQETALQGILSASQYSTWTTEKRAAIEAAKDRAATARDNAEDVRANREAVRQARRN